MPQTLQVVTTINCLIPPSITGDPQKELKEEEGTPENRNANCVFINSTKFNTRRNSRHFTNYNTLYYSDLKKRTLCIAAAPWLTLMDQQFWWTMDHSNKNQPNFWKIQLYGEYCCTLWEDSACVCFWYDQLVVLNVIRKIWWVLLIDFSDAAKYHEIRKYSTSQVMPDFEMYIAVTKKYKPLWHHIVVQKWWRIWKCALYYYP